MDKGPHETGREKVAGAPHPNDDATTGSGLFVDECSFCPDMLWKPPGPLSTERVSEALKSELRPRSALRLLSISSDPLLR